MHRQSSIPFNQSGIGVQAITMTAKTVPANAAAPITAAVFLLRFFFTALQISMAQTTQTAAAASAMTSVSHNHESSYNILIRSPYLSLANWKLLFHIHSFVKSRFFHIGEFIHRYPKTKILSTIASSNPIPTALCFLLKAITEPTLIMLYDKSNNIVKLI